MHDKRQVHLESLCDFFNDLSITARNQGAGTLEHRYQKKMVTETTESKQETLKVGSNCEENIVSEQSLLTKQS